jgi:hypothetical protein
MHQREGFLYPKLLESFTLVDPEPDIYVYVRLKAWRPGSLTSRRMPPGESGSQERPQGG